MLLLHVIAMEEIVRMREAERRGIERRSQLVDFFAASPKRSGGLGRFFGRSSGAAIVGQSPLAAVEPGFAGD